MTRVDYELITSILATANTTYRSYSTKRKVCGEIIQLFANRLHDSNRGFDKAEFLRGCGEWL